MEILNKELMRICEGGHLARKDASLYGHLENIKDLLLNGAQIHCTDCNGNTPLHLACLNDSLEVIRLIIQRGGDVSVANNCGDLPIDDAYDSSAPLGILRYLINQENKGEFTDQKTTINEIAASNLQLMK